MPWCTSTVASFCVFMLLCMCAEMLITLIIFTCHVNSFRKNAHAAVKLKGLRITVSPSGAYKLLSCVDHITPV